MKVTWTSLFVLLATLAMAQQPVAPLEQNNVVRQDTSNVKLQFEKNAINIQLEGKTVGTLTLNADQLRFTGNTEAGAKALFEAVIAATHERDKQLIEPLQKRIRQLSVLLQLYNIPLPAELP